MLKDSLILWIVDASYGTRHFEFVGGYLASHKVIFVTTGYRDKHLGSTSAYCSHGSYLTAITPNANAAKFINNGITSGGIFFQYYYLMPFIQQGLGQLKPYLTSANNNNVHFSPSFV